jgi:hypothetical protein
MRQVSGRAWDWGLAELRDKVSSFEEDQFFRLMDAGSAACKSDTLISESLCITLKDGVGPLLEEPKARQDCNPSQAVQKNIEQRCWSTFNSYNMEEIGYFCWSANFQMLPCEVQFKESGTDVHITPYINNLHPVSYKSLYGGFEKLISAAIKPWNECLVKRERSRWPIRINPFGLTWDPEYPNLVIDTLNKSPGTEVFQEAMKEAEKFLQLPNRAQMTPRNSQKNGIKVCGIQYTILTTNGQ